VIGQQSKCEHFTTAACGAYADVTAAVLFYFGYGGHMIAQLNLLAHCEIYTDFSEIHTALRMDGW